MDPKLILHVPEDGIYVVEEGTEGAHVRRLGLEEFLLGSDVG